MLKDLFTYASEVVGFQPTNEEKRQQLLHWINRAAKELWDCWDLPGSLMEQSFDLGDAATDVNVWEVTLPWYVDIIKAARFPQGMDRIKIQDIRPRFNNRPWKQPLLTWRILGESALSHNLSVDGQLVIQRGSDENTPFTVNVTGATGQSALTEESVTFVFGGGPELITTGQTNAASYMTQNQWVHDNPFCIRSITKSGVTLNDVIIYDQNGVEVARIPNRMTHAKNTVVQLHDDSKGLFQQQVELLFKTPFIPFYYDTDLFAQPKLEDAIIWKLRMLWYSTKTGMEENAILAEQKCLQLVQRVCGNIENATEKRFHFEPNQYEMAALKSYPYRYGRRS